MYVLCSVWTVARTNQGTAVLLREEESGKSLPLFVSGTEAQILLNNMDGKGKGKNSLHGYVSLLLSEGDFALKRIEVRDRGKNKPVAYVRAGQVGKDDFTRELPICDALALAVKNSLPVHVEETYFQARGVYLNLVELERKAKIRKLEEKLTTLVEKEEYEEAARIRDRLLELDLEESL